jgi:hypothetical protein
MIAGMNTAEIIQYGINDAILSHDTRCECRIELPCNMRFCRIMDFQTVSGLWRLLTAYGAIGYCLLSFRNERSEEGVPTPVPAARIELLSLFAPVVRIMYERKLLFGT